MTHNILNQLKKARILVYGDIILDNYIYGRVERISPEAPIPVMVKNNEKQSLGGAGNVAQNIVSLGANATLIGIIGKDEAGRNIKKICQSKKINTQFIFNGTPTTHKTRFVAHGQQMLRLDDEKIINLSPSEIAQIKQILADKIPQFDSVIISDYGKGMVHHEIVAWIVKLAKNHQKIVVADPKSTDFTKYFGVDYITPNRHELHLATKMPVANDDDIVAACHKIMQDAQIQGVLATRSEQGLSMISGDKTSHFATNARQVFDVSGAGDTVVAVFATALGVGIPPILSARIANTAGGVVVEKSGTAYTNLQEIAQLWHETAHHNAKLIPLSKIKSFIQKIRKANKSIIFTNGCFDLLHDGHVQIIKDAKNQGDFLIIGLNSDNSVQKLKGQDRPWTNFHLRADLLGGLPEVDAIIGFDTETPLELIKKIAPDVLVKGMDYQNKIVVGAEFAKRTHLSPLKSGYSSTNIINHLNKA